MVSANRVGEHLDGAASQGYLDAINGTTPESLIDARMKVSHFVGLAVEGEPHLPVLSIGVGQGEEPHALKSLSPDRPVVCFDLSQSALERTAQRSSLYDLGLLLTSGDARRLPFADQTLGGVVMSAVLHEIYSYFQPTGYESFQDAVVEAARVLRPGGALYVREFAAPPSTEPVRLVPSTLEAQQFLDFFTPAFRAGLDAHAAEDLRITVDEDGMLPITGDLTQLLMHFKNFWHDMTQGSTYIGDMEWKELRESYLIKALDQEQYLTPDSLCESVVKTVRTAGIDIEVHEIRLLDRRKTNLFLEHHFRIMNGANIDVTDTLLPSATSKMEALFLKR